jgi:hypothetical protein
MRPGIRVVNLVLLASTCLVAVRALPAQSLSPCVHQITFNMEREIFAVTRGNVRAAYTATVKQSFEQKLMDGNTIHWTVEAVQARDETGRTMRQHIEGCDADSGGQSPLRIRTSIYDPVSKTDTSWSTGPGSMALTTVFHQPEPFSPPIPPDWKDIPRTPTARYKPQITHEDLGTRTLAGMEATGTRQTEIVPAGFYGNDLPLKIVHETWMNVQNHATLLAIDDDPRSFGRHTWEVESLTVGAPDPALFTPPADYKVWEQNPRPQTTADAKP